MPETKKYQKGQTVYYLRTRCVVLENTLKPGEGNYEEAVLFLKSAQGSSIVVPVAFQDQFVSETPPKPLSTRDKILSAFGVSRTIPA